MTATKNQIERLARDWSQYAGEAVTVEQISGAFYGFCGELGTLRLFKKYRNTKGTDCGYSVNLNSFYFVLEISN